MFGTLKIYFHGVLLFPATCGRSWDHAKNGQKYEKSWFFDKKSIFFKVARTVRNINIWPEMDVWDVVESLYTHNHHLNTIWTYFFKIEKKSIFWFFICRPPHYEYRIFYFPAKYRPYGIGGTFKHLMALSKSKCRSPLTLVWFLHPFL